MLGERCRVHYNTIRPHSSLGNRPPVPEAWYSELKAGHGKVESKLRVPLSHTPDYGGYLNSVGSPPIWPFQKVRLRNKGSLCLRSQTGCLRLVSSLVDSFPIRLIKETPQQSFSECMEDLLPLR